MVTWQLLLKLLASTVELSGMHFPVSSAINYETVKLLMQFIKNPFYIFTVQFRVSMTISTIWID
jgi:hypothetical protein